MSTSTFLLPIIRTKPGHKGNELNLGRDQSYFLHSGLLAMAGRRANLTINQIKTTGQWPHPIIYNDG